jgi:[ribosomal protein S5]-alanine N-acetyltransferase
VTFRFPEGVAGPVRPEFADELRADGVVLRAPGHGDVARLAPAFVDPAVGGEAGLPPFDENDIHAFIDHQMPVWRESGFLVPYVIADAGSGELLGGATFHHLDPTRQVIELGYWLFASAHGRGVATRSVETMAEWAFGAGLHRVEAAVRVGNAASERVLERAGFAREGVKRRFLRHGGGRVDATLFARLEDDA